MSFPEGYKQIEYVESNGTGSYFKTGILPTADTRVVFDGYVISGDTALYGSRYAAGNNRYAVQYIGTNQYRLSYDTVESLVPSSYTKGTRYTFDQRNNKLYINDLLVASVTASPTYPNAREIYAVGALNTNNVATNLGVVRMYSMQIYQSGVQVGDFVPVQDPDGTIGIYNLVTDTFFRNAGTGNVAGGDVIRIVTGIEVTTLPDKLEYQCGEELDLTGMVVTATYSDGAIGIVKGYEVSGYDAALVGEQTVTVRYGAATTAFVVRVAKIALIVTFVDHDGTVLSIQQVKSGNAATAPENPSRIGYLFTGWDQDFTHITGDMTITAQYSTWTLVNGTLSISAAFNMSEYKYNTYPWYSQKPGIKSIVLLDGVTNIGEDAFEGCDALSEVIIPSSVTDIGAYAFSWCEVLTKIIIPNSVMSIGDSAFRGCSALPEITIPESSIIGIQAFADCATVTDLIIPGTIASIGREAFARCSSLAKVIIQNGITTIVDYMFSGCTSLAEIVIPNSVTDIGDSAFRKCSSLTGIAIPDSVTSIGDSTFRACTGLTGINIPNSITRIRGSAFRECTSLENITILRRNTEISDSSNTIPEGATIHGYTGSTAEKYAIKYNRKFVAISPGIDMPCSIVITKLPSKLEYLIGDSIDLTGIEVTATWENGDSGLITDYTVSGYDPYQVGEQTVTIALGDAADVFIVWVKGVDRIELIRNPNKTHYFVGEKFEYDGMQVVAHYTDGSYIYCTADVGVEFRNGSISEAPAAFGHFKEHTVEIPVQVNKAYIGDIMKEDVVLTYEFETDSCTIDGRGASGSISDCLGNYKEKVKKTSISGINSIPSGYLSTFTVLEEVSITAPIEELPSAVMMDCAKLKSIELPDSLKTIGYSCFYNCSALTDIKLPDSVERIYNAAFYMSGLQKISLSASLRTIGTGAFQGCKDLQNITLNAGLEEIGSSTFDGCEKLRVLIFPDSVTEINSSIYSLNALDYVKYPAGMTTIRAPHGTNAKAIVIPEGVTDITSGVFSGFGRIENVYLPNTLKTIENSCFAGCSSLKSISIPEGVETVWHGAFQDCGIEEIYFYGRNTVVSYDAYIPSGTVIHGYRGTSAEAYCKQFGNIFVPFDDYEFTEDVKNLYDTDSIRKRIVVHFPNGETRDIENDRIYFESMSLTESICDEENLIFGGCNASKFEIQVADVEEDIRGLEIEVKQYIEDKYVPLFMGVIDSADRQDNRRFKKITAYDRMYTVGAQDVTDWLRTIKIPISIMELRNKICEKLGFIQTSTALVNDYIIISKLSIKDGVTARDVLRAICEVNGVFGYITRMGYFDYVSLKTTEQPFSVTGYRKVRYEEYTVRGIESLSVRGSSGATILTIGTGNRYVLRDNFLVYGIVGDALQEAAKNLLQKIKGITYRDFSGVGRGLPYIFLGRHIKYAVNTNSVGKPAEVVDSYVLKRTLSGVQALKDTYSASGEEFQPDVPADASTSETARQLEDYVALDDFETELSTRFEEFIQGDQYQANIEQAVQNVLRNGGYFKIISVPSLPPSPAADTVYLIQGEVTVS